MTYLIIGIFLFAMGYKIRNQFKRSNHEAGVEGMNAILIAALILIIFYGVIDRLAIL